MSLYEVPCWERREVRVTYTVEADSADEAIVAVCENKTLPVAAVTRVICIDRRLVCDTPKEAGL